ncbi:MAG TPA: aminoglycoside phosphotransferase family protein [Jiangellaceae bacterium]|nr:aminoglycoside phosphotransferase family protein [Jiangellaceae bacterium]
MLTERMAAEVATAFGLGGDAILVGPVAAGRVGQVWRLDTAQGRFAVKQSTDGWEPADAERDAAYQEKVRARGVPMPAVVRSASGAVLADVAGSQVRVYEWVDVLGPSRSLDPAAVGRLVAAIHTLHVPTTLPVTAWSCAPIGRAGWDDIVRRLARADAPFAGRLADIVPDAVAAEALLVAPDTVQWCHLDLWADNVLRTPAGGLAVLDWENSGPGSPSQELMAVVFEYGCGDSHRMRELYAAYVAAGGPGRLTGRADATMLLAQMAHIALTGCTRWLESTTDAERADNAAWVGEFIDEPVTVDTVDAILDAVGQPDR